MSSPFQIDAPFEPKGDQPQAIAQLVDGVHQGLREQVLMGVTGSGKTNVMGWAIQELGRPVLVLSPNKTLAAQLCAEFRRLFPRNAVDELGYRLRLVAPGLEGRVDLEGAGHAPDQSSPNFRSVNGGALGGRFHQYAERGRCGRESLVVRDQRPQVGTQTEGGGQVDRVKGAYRQRDRRGEVQQRIVER